MGIRKLIVLFILFGILQSCVLKVYSPYNQYTAYNDYLPLSFFANLSIGETLTIGIENITYYQFLGTESKRIYEKEVLLDLTPTSENFEKSLVFSCQVGAIDTGGEVIHFFHYKRSYPPSVFIYLLLPILALSKRKELFLVCLMFPIIFPSTPAPDIIYFTSILSAYVGMLIFAINIIGENMGEKQWEQNL